MTDDGAVKRGKPDMSLFRSKDTKLERTVRSFIHGRGLRYKLASELNKKLPCKPDIILPIRGTAIFVHGCYWHRHSECRSGSDFPKNPEKGRKYWEDKFRKNIERDLQNTKSLQDLGWHVEIIWGCQIKDRELLEQLVRKIRTRGIYVRRGNHVFEKSG